MPASKKPNKNTGTTTSAFGSAGRISHNASGFYNSRLYDSLPQDTGIQYQETPLPPETRNQIICASSEHMSHLPDNSVHLMITSPPYNVGKEYDQDLTLAEYLGFLNRVWSEVHRVLVPGGRACINVANLGRKPYIPLHAFIIAGMLDLGFLMRGEIIWDKAASAASSTAWGSWLSATNPTLRDVHEYILVFSKAIFKRPKPQDRPPTIQKEEFLEYTKSVWSFPSVSAKKIGHPAPFPIELPRRLIQLYTFKDDVILDPFMGSGQVALAAIETNRDYVGYEIDPQYVELTQRRIQDQSP